MPQQYVFLKSRNVYSDIASFVSADQMYISYTLLPGDSRLGIVISVDNGSPAANNVYTSYPCLAENQFEIFLYSNDLSESFRPTIL